MSIDNFSREYQPPKIPTHWGTEERRYAQAVADVLDDIYLKYGRLGKKELSAALGKEITDATGNVSLLQQTATNFLLEVANSKIYRYPDEASLIAALAGMEPPVSMEVGLLWLDTTLNAVKRCSSVSPLTWQDVKANELHTSYIDIAADLLKLFSGAKIQLLSGSEIELLSGSTIKVISGSGTSYISLDNSREDNCFLFFGGETPETAPAAFWRDGTIKNVANTYVQTAADNADATHGIVMDVFFPSDVTLVDKVMLSCKFSAFRAYETGAASGGSATATSESGGGAEKTSRSGGGGSVTSGQDAAGANTKGSGEFYTGYQGEESTKASSAANTGLGGAHSHSVAAISENAPTSDPGGHTHTGPSHLHTIESHTHTGPSHSHTGPEHVHTGNSHSHAWSDTSGGPSTNSTSSDGSHSHTITNHRHAYTMGATYTGYTQPNSVADGSHSHTMGSHTHYVSGTTDEAGTGNTGAAGTGATGTAGTGATGGTALSTNNAGTGATGAGGGHTHTFTVKAHDTGGAADHTHGMSHTHGLYLHTHLVGAHVHGLNQHTHNVTVGAHSHIVDIDAHTHSVSIPAHTHDMTYGIYEGTTPATCTVYVDGSAVAGLTGVGPFINTDIAGAFLKSGGKIVRDAFHTVEIRPDKLGRISAHMYIKTTQVSKVAGAL